MTVNFVPVSLLDVLKTNNSIQINPVIDESGEISEIQLKVIDKETKLVIIRNIPLTRFKAGEIIRELGIIKDNILEKRKNDK